MSLRRGDAQDSEGTMSVSDDVGNLFRRFGGDAGQYQEVARDDDAKEAALRWPLLNALDIVHAQPVPNAGRAAPTGANPPVPAAHAAAPASQAEKAADTHTDAPGPARAPLFARGHRHSSMPPPVAQAPAAASRFSAPPAALASVVTPAAVAPADVSPATTTERVALAMNVDNVPPATSPAPAMPAPAQAAALQQPAPFASASSQTFATAPINNRVAQTNRTEPRNDSILSGLFGGKAAQAQAQAEPEACGPSRDLATLFARLSHPSGAPARSLRDSLRSRLKRDGDA